ncbi:MAG TPA: LuxR family transcriptional regulator [Solirubrobacterales bacterium]|nr:LuxR family transcriptional regulator [Solirubrobacterales bacterium]
MNPDLVGRESEIVAVGEALARAGGGLAGCLLSGPPGIGKTTVWREGVEQARPGGRRLLVTRPAEPEVRLAYSGLADLLDGVGDAWLGRLPVVQRRALKVALLRGDEGGAVDARAVASGLGSLFRELAPERPLLVAVDDAQWLDAESSAALGYALRRLTDRPIAVLATLRLDDGARPSSFLDVLPGQSLTEVHLGPLDAPALGLMLHRRLDLTLPRPTLVRLAAETAGNPLHALEVGRRLKRDGTRAHGRGLPVPEDLRALLAARLRRLDVRTQEALLEVAALADPHTDLVPEEDLARAEEAGIVRIEADGRIELAHPLFATAIQEVAPAARRRSAHRRLAGLVAAPQERARHLALATRGRDEDVARALEEASRLAAARGAPAAAAELAELALDLGADDSGRRGERLVNAAGRHFESGDLDRAAELLEEALGEAPAGSRRARALLLQGLIHSRHYDLLDTLALLSSARAAGLEDPVPDHALLAEIDVDLAFFGFISGSFEEAAGHAEDAVRAAAAAGDEGLSAVALSVRTAIRHTRGRGVAEADLEWAVAHEDPGREDIVHNRPRLVSGYVALCLGRVEEAAGTLGALHADLLARGRETDLPALDVYRVWAASWAGHVDRALVLADEGLVRSRLVDDPLAIALALSVSAIAAAHAGLVERARDDGAAAIDRMQSLRWAAPLVFPAWALGLLELSAGRPERTVEILAPLLEQVASFGPVDPAALLPLTDAVEALVELDRGEEAAALLAPFERVGREADRAWVIAAALRCQGLLRAADGDPDGALEALGEALRQHDRVAMPGERARTLLVRGSVLRRARRRRLAREAVGEALEVFDGAGMRLWAGRAEEELRRLGAVPARDARLTPTELVVAELAAAGATNREIAAQAFISVKTVEARLGRSYRKLGIRSRAQLADALAGRARPPAT